MVFHVESFWGKGACGQRASVRGSGNARTRGGATSLCPFCRKFGVQFVGGLQSYRAFHCVFQLSNISRPFVAAQLGQTRGVNVPDLFPRRRRVFLKEMIHQQGDILRAFAQRGHADGNHIQAVVEILAEQAFLDHLIKIAVGGGDDSDIDCDFARSADGPDETLLQNAQQLHLHGQAGLADLVQEDGAAVGDFKQAALVLVRARKRALNVAKQLAFEQSFGKRAAVDRDKRFACARGAGMDGARSQLFAGSALALNQNRAAGGGNGPDGLLQLLHGGAGADNVVERIVGGGIAPEREILPIQALALHGPSYGKAHIVHQPWAFADVIGRSARFHGFDGRFIVIDRGNQDDGGIRRNLMRVLENFDAVRLGHANVGYDHVVEC